MSKQKTKKPATHVQPHVCTLPGSIPWPTNEAEWAEFIKPFIGTERSRAAWRYFYTGK